MNIINVQIILNIFKDCDEGTKYQKWFNLMEHTFYSPL